MINLWGIVWGTKNPAEFSNRVIDFYQIIDKIWRLLMSRWKLSPLSWQGCCDLHETVRKDLISHIASRILDIPIKYYLPFPFPPMLIIGQERTRSELDVKIRPRSFGVIAGGQSGHFLSKHYDDQIDKWLEGKYYRLIHSQEEPQGKNLLKMILKP